MMIVNGGDSVPCLALWRDVSEDGGGDVQLLLVHLPTHCHGTLLQVLTKTADRREKEGRLNIA